MSKQEKYIRNIDIILMSFIFLLLFITPLIFVKDGGKISWQNVTKIWQDRVLLVPLFAINHWILIPKLVLKKKYTQFFLLAATLIILVSGSYYYIEKSSRKGQGQPPPPPRREQTDDRQPRRKPNPFQKPINPIPPYADLLLLALLIVSVDTGLSFTKHWHDTEEDKTKLEKENIQAQLGILRNQVSPHFFMNTLNNIYSLIEADKKRSREAVMKLSKLMRYLLYENQDGKVLLSKEFEFIKSYIDLMKLRFVNDVEIKLTLPETYSDIEIPVLIFISYLENAFKFGTSYENKSSIHIHFRIEAGYLYFTCINNKNGFSQSNGIGGIGLENSKKRLDLLFQNKYDLIINETIETYTVNLKIPIA